MSVVLRTRRSTPAAIAGVVFVSNHGVEAHREGQVLDLPN